MTMAARPSLKSWVTSAPFGSAGPKRAASVTKASAAAFCGLSSLTTPPENTPPPKPCSQGAFW